MSSTTDKSVIENEKWLQRYARRLKWQQTFQLWKWRFDVSKDSLPWRWRLATQRFRHLPTAVIVGAQKSGTTQLYSYLVTHPRCFEAAEKEVDFFSKHPERTVEWYRSRFPLRRLVERRRGQVLEASPSYLPTPSALRKMKSVLPNARMIVLLRDPVSRAFSHYQHKKTRHVERRSFEEVVEDEIRDNAFPAERELVLQDNAKPMLGYVARGYYALQLELLYTLYPRNRVLVIDSASLFANTAAVCAQVFNFLELESFDVSPSKVYNRGLYKEKIDPRVAERLRAHYRPYDELLRSILGQPFRWMECPASDGTGIFLRAR